MISFNSWPFIFFLTAIVIVYWRLPHRKQNALLLAASVVFYGSWDWRFLFLLLASTSIDYYCAARISSSSDAADRKRHLWISVGANLAALGTFKYLGFFVATASPLLAHLGVDPARLHLNLVLPIGISFYTFRAISYVADVYRGEIRPSPSYASYMLYILFFPALVAGPIERAGHLLPQIEGARAFDGRRFWRGVDLVLWGLLKKVMIADNVAYYVDLIFNNAAPSTLLIFAGCLGFGIQIFCDFSGYTDIARGAARLLGFELVDNFDSPYLADSPADFWRRWHISLSTFVRDYVYRPLGGSRCPLPRYLFNVLVTWFLMGLWHGAAWHYVAWGLYHGALVAGHRFWRKRRPEGAPSGAWTVPATYLAMNAGWLLFRAPDLGAVANYFSGAARAASVPDGAAAAIMLLIFLIYSIPLLLALLWERRPAAFSGIDAGAVRIVYSAACLLCLLVFGGISNEFIYFQF